MAAPELVGGGGGRMPIRQTIERMLAVGYGVSYDAVVRGFRPYQALLDEISALIESVRPAGPRLATRVLDVSCGTGTVAARLAADGYSVVGVDAVSHLVSVARETYRHRGLSLTFQHLDVATNPLPEAGTFDVLVSMHTLYWHPDPQGLLAACRRALKPGGHAILLTYGRRARVGRIFADVRRTSGLRDAARSLRWLVPTALFEALRGSEPRYLGREEFHQVVAAAGFEIREYRETFLAGISRLVLARTTLPGGTSPVGSS
jgi:SAM-dependent methyltransferase